MVPLQGKMFHLSLVLCLILSGLIQKPEGVLIYRQLRPYTQIEMLNESNVTENKALIPWLRALFMHNYGKHEGPAAGSAASLSRCNHMYQFWFGAFGCRVSPRQRSLEANFGVRL